MRRKDPWLSTREACLALGVNLRSLYRTIDDGRLPCYQFGRVYRLELHDVAELAIGRAAPSISPEVTSTRWLGLPRVARVLDIGLAEVVALVRTGVLAAYSDDHEHLVRVEDLDAYRRSRP